jgi:hypothetical protein
MQTSIFQSSDPGLRYEKFGCQIVVKGKNKSGKRVGNIIQSTDLSIKKS